MQKVYAPIPIANNILWLRKDIGYIIPIPVVMHFLEDVERNKGTCSGFCDIGIQIQLMESEHIRKSMGMTPEQTGILVNKVLLLAFIFAYD